MSFFHWNPQQLAGMTGDRSATFPFFSKILASRLMEIATAALSTCIAGYTRKHTRNNTVRKIIFSLSFRVVRRAQGGCPKHRTKYILLNKRGSRNKCCVVHPAGYHSNRILAHAHQLSPRESSGKFWRASSAGKHFQQMVWTRLSQVVVPLNQSPNMERGTVMNRGTSGFLTDLPCLGLQ